MGDLALRKRIRRLTTWCIETYSNCPTDLRAGLPVASSTAVRKLTFGIIIVHLSAGLARAQGAPTLSLDEAIRLALANNRTVASTALEVDKAANDAAVARSKRLPQFQIEMQASQLLQPVDLTFPAGSFGTFAGIGPVPATDSKVTTPAGLSFVSNVQASQPLTPLFKLNLNVKLTETAQHKAAEQLRDTKLALVAEVRRTYYDIAQTESAYEANERSIALLQELSRVVGTRLIQQTALKSDALATESKLARAEVSRLELQQAIDSRKEQLNLLLGRDVRTAFVVAAMPEAVIPTISVETAQERGVDARPDVRQARAALEQADIARRIAKADYIPDVNLTASYLTPMNIDGAPGHIASAALQLRWEPFDWGRKARTLASKDLSLQQARNSVRDAEDRAALDISAKVRAVDAARARLKALRLSADAAHEGARISLMQYSAHATLFADVLQTQSSAADADHQIQQALAAFWAAQADLERAMAEDIQ